MSRPLDLAPSLKPVVDAMTKLTILLHPQPLTVKQNREGQWKDASVRTMPAVLCVLFPLGFHSGVLIPGSLPGVLGLAPDIDKAAGRHAGRTRVTHSPVSL